MPPWPPLARLRRLSRAAAAPGADALAARCLLLPLPATEADAGAIAEALG
jgi:hypothetical protein